MKLALTTVVSLALVAVVATIPAGAKAPGSNGRITYAQFNPAGVMGDVFLYTANPDGSEQRQILSTDWCCPVWSPDGSKMAISGAGPDGRITTALLNPDGSHLDVKTIPDPTLNLGCSAWSPDGARMLCSGWDDLHRDRPRGLFSVRVSDWGDLKQLTTNPNGATGQNDDPGDYSPDGKRIVFLREGPDEQNALYVASADGTHLNNIAPSANPDCCGASWSPNGKWILFTWIGVPEVVHPDGTGLHQLTLKARCVHRSGRAVLAGIPVYQLRCRRGHFAMDPNILYWVVMSPTWSPDGKQLAFDLAVRTSAGSVKQGVYTANANGSGVKPLIPPVTAAWKTLDFPGSIDWGPAG